MKYAELFKRHIPNLKHTKSGDNYLGLCPFHPDTNPSFSCNFETGFYNCFGCQKNGNAISFAKHFGEDPTPYYTDGYKSVKNGISKAKSIPSKTDGKQTANKPQKPQFSTEQLEEMAKEYNQRLNPDDKYWDANMVGKYDNGSLTFPYFTSDGKVKGIHIHKSAPHWIGDGENSWYNVWNLDYEVDVLYICEGEKDTLYMMSKGFHAISQSAGCTSIPKTTPPKITTAKEIRIIYDNDKGGRVGGGKLASHLSKLTDSPVYVCHWREDLPQGYDVTDSELGEEFENAVKNKTQETQSSKNTKGYVVMNVLDALDLSIDKPSMIVEDILNENGATLLASEDNVGKSMMANQLGICIATGQQFLDYEVPNARKVLLVQHEMENGEQFDRLSKQLGNNENMDLIRKNLEVQVIQESDRLAVTDQFVMLENTFEENPHIEVCIFDNIGMSTNVEMTNPDEIRRELKRLKDLCRRYNVAFVLVAHKVKIKWATDMDLLKTQIQGGKPVTDWADNIIQLHTSSLNEDLILFKLTKVRSVHNDRGESTKNLPQGVWWNQNGDLLFSKRFTLTNWQSHFKALDKYEDELAFVKELATHIQPFDRTVALEVGRQQELSIPTTDRWLRKLVKDMKWLKKESYGKWSVNKEVLDYILISEG